MSLATIEGSTNKVLGGWSEPVCVTGSKGDPGTPGVSITGVTELY
jgi:hypothetical protein